MNLNLAKMRCPMCMARLLAGYKQLPSSEADKERYEVKCRQGHEVRVTVRKVSR